MTFSSSVVVPLHDAPSAEWLDAVLDVLGRRYRFVSLEELEAGLAGRMPRGACHLTFDDGHRSFVETVLPAIRSRRIHVSLFVSPAVIARGGNYWFQDLVHLRRHVSDDVLRKAIADLVPCAPDRLRPFSVMSLFLSLPRDAMQRVLDAVAARHAVDPLPPQNIDLPALRRLAGEPLVHVGAHTLEHPVLANETDERAAREISASVDELSEIIGRRVTSFAYPNGIPGLDFGAREEACLRQAGVRVAFTTRPGFVGGDTSPLAIPRGGAPDRHGEPARRTLMRLALLPWWETLRQWRPNAPVAEERERHAILASGVLEPVRQSTRAPR